MILPLNFYLILAAIIFSFGLFGVLTRRSIVIIIMCIELMFNAVNINFVAFSSYLGLAPVRGQIFAIFVMLISAVEMGVGMGIALLLYKNRTTVEVNRINLMRW